MKEQLLSKLQEQENLGQDLTTYLLREMSLGIYNKGHLILRQGEICQRIWFLVRGFAKSRYFDQQGKQLVTRFWKENEIIIAKDSFNNSVPAPEDIILLENATLLSLTYQQAEHICKTYSESHAFVRRIHVTDQRQNQLRSRLLTLRTIDAYEAFCEAFRDFPLNRLQLQDIAAYLNHTAQSISRARRSMAQKK